MNLNGKAALATDEDLATYDRKLSDLERELERRMALGQQFEAVLARQEQMMKDDETGRENHQVGGVIQCNTLQHRMAQDSARQYHTAWYNTMQSIMQCSIIQYLSLIHI